MKDEYVNRKHWICKALREKGFDHAILGMPTTLFYLTGISVMPFERYYGLTVDVVNEKYTMIVPALDKGCMRYEVTEYVYQDAQGPRECILKSLHGCKKLAVETKYFSIEIGNIFREICDQVENIGNCIDRMRMKKTAQEIEAMQTAADIVDDTLQHMKTWVQPGMTEKEINMEMFSYMANIPGVNSEEKIILVQGGKNSANPHGISGDYQVKKGDILLLDFCAYYKNYWSDITRCFFMGTELNPKLEEIYEIVKRANLEAISKVHPGISASEIDRTARKVITDAGYGEYFLHRTGHGLGLSVHEEPFITEVNDLVLEEGMTFTIEPGIYLDGIGGVRIEDDILVTKDGCRVLTKSSKCLKDYIIPC